MNQLLLQFEPQEEDFPSLPEPWDEDDGLPLHPVAIEFARLAAKEIFGISSSEGLLDGPLEGDPQTCNNRVGFNLNCLPEDQAQLSCKDHDRTCCEKPLDAH